MNDTLADGVPFQVICGNCKQPRGKHYSASGSVKCPDLVGGFRIVNTKGVVFSACTQADEEPLKELQK